jgi:hypothetical protein
LPHPPDAVLRLAQIDDLEVLEIEQTQQVGLGANDDNRVMVI